MNMAFSILPELLQLLVRCAVSMVVVLFNDEVEEEATVRIVWAVIDYNKFLIVLIVIAMFSKVILMCNRKPKQNLQLTKVKINLPRRWKIIFNYIEAEKRVSSKNKNFALKVF